MSRPQRRGSHSSNMLKPSVTIVQSEHNADGTVRRRSLPNHLMGSISSHNGTTMAPHQQKQQQQSGHHTAGVPQAQFAQPQQQSNTARSFASSMDIISSSTLSGQTNRAAFPPVQNSLFQSSSHHTSHTAAAGDLLSMSRLVFEPPKTDQTSLRGKKRSATITEDPGNDANMNGMSDSGQQQQHNTGAQDVSAIPPNTSTFYNDNGFDSLTTPKIYNNVSSSTFASQGGADESYQQHRTIRRCQRSDSFEMMEDD